MPKLIGVSTVHHILALEDIKGARDFSHIYKKGEAMGSAMIERAMTFLSGLHRTKAPQKLKRAFPQNISLRYLNAEHLFRYPFLVENGFDLDSIQPGLQKLSMRYKTDEALKSAVEKVANQYLARNTNLLHGDFYPGSLLQSGEKLWVIDPEFSFIGPPEYDFGVFIAHLFLAQAPAKEIEAAFAAYRHSTTFRWHIAAQFAGVEILRRIIGLAQLPLDLSLEERAALLEKGAAMVMNRAF